MINLVIDDDRGRRMGIDRREICYAAYLPERRSDEDRRSGFERRSPTERSSNKQSTDNHREFFTD